MVLDDPCIEVIANDNISTYVNTIDTILSRKFPEILFCFVTNNRGDRYNAIKKRCCVDRNGKIYIYTKN
jgi:hypothetical protein